ncbi:helix-turn-helix domain-containing protein [Streptomyces sp. S.PNR 29]|uniref:helix-turn-helix domain-containing protein n=1 Tax=Streptomyces sp. S.PNR 29 TaxID=2973805 RepID=UPI0025AED44A|nr:helix-turn-helix domain-containing protein [Streptomyces sp. S.PNR 29]MDN0198337.1 helix-turn-helix domain-containing protein [Streptomyces sp. S.PNR 29]
MSGATEPGEIDALAQLLRELKDRSGLSYGALAKRLHMSTSTLHRYCNGTAVPVEYAPVERLARVCRATPQELVELHRRWILADAARGRKADQEPPAPAAATGPAQDAGAEGSANSDGSAGSDDSASSDGSADSDGAAGNGDKGENGERVVVGVPGAPSPPRRLRRRTVLTASVAVAAALAAVALTVRPTFGDGNDTLGRQADTATESTAGPVDSPKPSTDPSPSGKARKPSASASASPTGSQGVGSGTSKGDGKRGGVRSAGGATKGSASGADPLAVGTRPYVYEDPCSQHFLVNSEPEQVGPPANERDAPRWAAAYGAVSSGEQRVALTVQGTGEDTVVLEELHVRVLTKGAPLAWNDYSMGVGCGGGVGTKSFDIDLDNGSPRVTVKNGQRDFPYKVSESDPEVFYITAHTKAHDVRWDLVLDWSSGSRRGTVHIDNDGTPFRTSAGTGRPGYDYPLGGGEWIERVN